MSQSVLDQTLILIVDKEGVLAEAFCKRLSKETNLVIVSSKQFIAPNVVFVPFKKKIPVIPGFTYQFIFAVWDSPLLKSDLLYEIARKAKNDQASFVIIFSVFEKNQKLFEKVKGIYSKSKIAVLGEMFGKNLPASFSLVSEILNNSKKQKGIKISNMGLAHVFPVFFDDAVEEILKLAFSSLRKPLLIFPKTVLTELSFVRMVQKIDPWLKVDFEKGKEEEREPNIPEEGEYAFPSYHLLDKVKDVFESIPAQKKEVEDKDQKERFNKKHNKQKRLYLIPLLLLIIFIFVPILATASFSVMGGWQLKKSIKSFESAKSKEVISSSSLAKKLFSLANSAYGFSIIKNSYLSGALIKGEKASEIVYLSSEAFEKIKEGKFSESSFYIKKANSALSFLKTEKLSKDELKSLERYEPSLKFLGNLIDISPDFLGFYGKRKYLVLFQNNMELRPGGGFIGSYGLLSIEKGKIIDFSINDVYSADGQLKGHVEPPFAIRRYMPLVHLYLRDSNFSPDFSINAQKAKFLLEAETKAQVSGVIGIDVSFVKTLLSVTGPLYIPDFDETVTEDNFYILTQSHSERNFFPGSKQKRDFLRSLFGVIKTELTENRVSYFNLLSALQEGIFQKHVLFSADNKNVQKVFELNKMSSRLKDEREEGPEIVNDFIGINEANLGVNKANYFIKRKIEHKVTFEGEDLIASTTINYKNTSDTWPGGDYKNYLRLFLPKGAEILSIIIDGKEQKITPAITNPLIYEAKNFRPPKELEVEISEEEEKRFFGFLLMVGRGELKKVELNYKLPGIISKDLFAFSYNLRIFKQAGTEEYPFYFSLSSSDFEILKGQNSFETKLNSDLDLVFKLAKK